MIVYCCEIYCTPVSTQCCCNTHIVLNVVEYHQSNTVTSGKPGMHCFWNNGNSVDLTAELRPLQGDCEVIISKVDHICPDGNLRRVGSICILMISLQKKNNSLNEFCRPTSTDIKDIYCCHQHHTG